MFRQISVPNSNTPQTIGNATVEPSNVTNQELSNFYESYCSSLQEKTSEVIPTKNLSGVSPTICNSPSLQITNSWSMTTGSIIKLVEVPQIVIKVSKILQYIIFTNA